MVTPPSCDFTCDNGQCVRESNKCNGRDDCGDNSDEQNCGIYRNHTYKDRESLHEVLPIQVLVFHLILAALNTTSLVTMGSVCLMVSSVINMMTVGMAVTKKTVVYTIIHSLHNTMMSGITIHSDTDYDQSVLFIFSQRMLD